MLNRTLTALGGALVPAALALLWSQVAAWSWTRGQGLSVDTWQNAVLCILSLFAIMAMIFSIWLTMVVFRNLWSEDGR